MTTTYTEQSQAIAQTYTAQIKPDEELWETLYATLNLFITSCVHDFSVPGWQGQETDIIEDIVQESIRKILERIQKAARGTASPIQSLPQMSKTIAYNTYRDYRRRDRRLYHIDTTCSFNQYRTVVTESPLETVIEELFQEQVFTKCANTIAHFPPKQKAALLTDLANRMIFTDTDQTPLQKALRQAGIVIEQYRHPLPTDRVERYRHASILNHAYRRIRSIAQQERNLEN